jgi:glucose/arabinose dehydrogenase
VPGWQDNWLDEIYAYGFRNPFRIGFDRANGDLYAADVGQDRNQPYYFEEVDKINKGGNYGWVIKSGTARNENAGINALPLPANTTLIDPIAQYPTSSTGLGGLAVIGGFVYRGTAVPQLFGKYIFGDLDGFNNGNSRMLYTDVSDASLQVFDLTILGSVAKPTERLHAVAEDARGELYFMFQNGQIMKLVPEPAAWMLALIAAALCAARSRRRPSISSPC